MRYSRQEILPEIGVQGQQRLRAAHVLVVGAGGLGCPVLLYLAAAGIGTIGIVDFDRVDESNLQRQVLFTMADCGLPKVAAARARLAALNPEIIVNVYDEELTDKNVISFFSGYDLIVDATDNFAAKFLINDAALKLRKTVVYGAIQGFEGQVSVFNYADGPCYRCLHPQPPQAQIENCAQAGIIGAVAGIIGTMQAMEAIKVIVSHESFQPLSGKLWMVDMRTMETNILSVPKQKTCRVCASSIVDIVPQYTSPVCAATRVEEVNCIQAAEMKDADFIDVREREEWDGGHIRHAKHLPLSALKDNPELFRVYAGKAPCILYCQRGRRSVMAAEILMRAGFSGLFSMTGGYEAWQDANT